MVVDAHPLPSQRSGDGFDHAGFKPARFKPAGFKPAGFDPAFVQRVLDDALRDGLRCYGITGLQGSGKSTLAQQMTVLATQHGHRVVTLSIDDFYLDKPEREALARKVHPLLATRGPPGTHDVALACATLDALAAGRQVALPRFDKLSDRRLPEHDWPVVHRARHGSRHGSGAGNTLVVLEGWFLGVPPQAEDALADPVNALERNEDPHALWRNYCNTALAKAYPPLWARIDRLLYLQGPGFDVVPGWRWQQECALRAARGAAIDATPDSDASSDASDADAKPPASNNHGATGMDRKSLERFVQHFERISRHALRTLPALADWVVPLDTQRQPMER